MRWVHPYDANGRRRPFSELPKTVKGMEDDPYRSLAGELRNLGGFAKDSSPFSEFLWADFLRPRIKARTIKTDFDGALAKALTLAKSGDADYLAGLVRAPRLCVTRIGQGEGSKGQRQNRPRRLVLSGGRLTAPIRPIFLSRKQQPPRLVIDRPIAGRDDAPPLGGVLAVPGRDHAARPFDDRRERDDVVGLRLVSMTRSMKPAASAQ